VRLSDTGVDDLYLEALSWLADIDRAGARGLRAALMVLYRAFRGLLFWIVGKLAAHHSLHRRAGAHGRLARTWPVRPGPRGGVA
jgi:hypothetical protein